MEALPVTYTSTQFSGSISDSPEDIWVVYDSECPFCSRYVLLYRLREQGRRVHLIDARSDHPLVEAIRRRKLDLNEGMVVRWQGEYHYGGAGLHLLGLLGGGPTGVNCPHQAIFLRPHLAPRL